MIDKEIAVEIATKRIQRIYPEAQYSGASHSKRLEEFDEGETGWRVWFRVKDFDIGDCEREVEVSDATTEARVVKTM